MTAWRLSRFRMKKPKRRGYVRPSRAKPKPGWSLRELATLVGLAPRSLKRYLESGVLSKPAFKGPATRYQRLHLVRLVVARALMTTERLSLTAVRSRLQSLSSAELDVLAANAVPPGPLATALGLPPPAPSLPDASAAGSAVTGFVVAPRWTRLELALGLELHLREDASPQVTDMARRIRGMFAG